jgi:curved DNA-binding protein
MIKDYYSILGVEKTATQEEIKKAYRRLAAQHHPDRGGNKEKFQEVQAAYDTLGDSEKRSQYDNHINGRFSFTGGVPPGFEDIFSAFGGSPFGDFFGQRSPRSRNRVMNLQTSIDLKDAFLGKELVASITLPSGKEQTLNIKIPAGIHDGVTLRLAGIGDDTNPNIPRGDIHLTIHVLPDPVFQRNGDDLIRRVVITGVEAMLGKTIKVGTIDGKNLDVDIAPGTQPGTILAVQGHGMPNVNNNLLRGRLLLEVSVQTLSNLTEEQKNILRQAFT